MRMAADFFLLAGSLFTFIAALGLLRMPDAYNRIQAGTKAATLGVILILVGIGFLYPEWWAKLLSIAGFVLFTNPVSSSTIARAIYRAGVVPWKKPDNRGELS